MRLNLSIVTYNCPLNTYFSNQSIHLAFVSQVMNVSPRSYLFI